MGDLTIYIVLRSHPHTATWTVLVGRQGKKWLNLHYAHPGADTWRLISSRRVSLRNVPTANLPLQVDLPLYLQCAIGHDHMEKVTAGVQARLAAGVDIECTMPVSSSTTALANLPTVLTQLPRW